MVVPHPRIDTYALLTRPPLTELPLPVRLACVKHAASVHSEPGSNSQVHLRAPCPRTRGSSTNRPELVVCPGHHEQPEQPSKRNCTHQRRYASGRPKGQTNEVRVHIHPDHRSGRSISPVLAHEDPRAPPTYPFLAYATIKDRSEVTNGPGRRAHRMTCSDVRRTRRRTGRLTPPRRTCKR